MTTGLRGAARWLQDAEEKPRAPRTAAGALGYKRRTRKTRVEASGLACEKRRRDLS